MPALTERALERRLKRHVLKADHSFFAPCAPGFEDVLAAELAGLPGVSVGATERGGVSFSGPLDTVYHANLRLRTAHRVLLRLGDFLAQSYPALFNRVTRLPWEHYIGFHETYSLRISAKASRVRHHKNIAKTVQGGISKALEPHGLKPGLDTDAPLEFHVRLFQDRCTISLNTSGEHLHKRGYRTHISEAPLRETLAASCLMSLGAKSYDLVLDPLCGSGTLLIEAALLAKRVMPGLRRSFAFEQMPSFQATKWERFRREAASEQRESSTEFLGNDIDPAVIAAARANAARAELTDCTTFQVGAAETLLLPPKKRSLLVSNVPYGERLGSQDSAEALLQTWAEHLAQNYSGWDYGFITKNSGWLERAKFSVRQKRPLSNGGLNVFLVSGHIG